MRAHQAGRCLAAILVTSALAAPAAAQCTDQEAAATPGRWLRDPKELPNADVTTFQRQFPRLAATADRAQALMEQAMPTLVGVEGWTTHTVDGRSLAGTRHIQFGVRAIIFAYYCVPSTGYAPPRAGTVQLEDESGTWIYIQFNTLSWLTNDSRRLPGLRAPGGGSIYFAPRPGTPVRGVPVVLPEVVPPKYGEEALVLTSGGRDPWVPLTRGALIDARIAALQLRLDSLPNLPATRAAADLLRAEQAQLVAARDAMTGAERDLPAVVKNPYAPPGSLFVSAESGGRALVFADRAFFRKGSPRDDIQLITVYWMWDRNSPLKVALIEQFKASLDIDALRGMLASD